MIARSGVSSWSVSQKPTLRPLAAEYYTPLAYSVVVNRDFDSFPVPALNDVAQAVGGDPCAAVYMSRLPAKIIICPVGSVERGFHVEQEPLAVLPYACSTDALGQTVWESLLQFKATPGLNLRSGKKDRLASISCIGSKEYSGN